MSAVARAKNIADLRAIARRRLPRGIFEYIDRGTEDEVALRRNREAFDRIRLRPRMLVDVSARTADCTILGRAHAMPLAVAPTGAAGLVWYEGELEIACAAKAASIPCVLATGSITELEKIAATGVRAWYQLYMWAERRLSYDLVNRAKAAGFEALIVTVDTPVAANREYNDRNGFNLPFRLAPRAAADMLLHPEWLATVLFRYVRNAGMPRYVNFPPEARGKITRGSGRSPLFRSDSLTWEDIRELRRRWDGPFMVKGILRPDDAVRAVREGADAVIVSNHGGRNLDSAVAPIDVLPEIADAVGGRAAVILDSGIRRGSDIIKAVALGAQAVLAGRAPLYGCAAGGREGAAQALAILRRELDIGMALSGCPTIADIGPDLLDAPPGRNARELSPARTEPASFSRAGIAD